VHFSAYQPEFNRFSEYCHRVPRAGRTLLVFDLVGSGLAERTISVQISVTSGSQRIAIPARRYPAGVIYVEADLAPGNYDATLTIGSPPMIDHITFDVAVGTWWQPLVLPTIIASLLLLTAMIYCIHQTRLLVGEVAGSPILVGPTASADSPTRLPAEMSSDGIHDGIQRP
jgi:hypothetical protein